MNLIRLQPLVGSLLLAWTGFTMAQPAGNDSAAVMRESYETLRDSAPITEQQQKLFEHEIKALELKQAWEGTYRNAAGTKKAVQQAEEATGEEDVEYFIVE